jgi:hypothetical protein
MSNLCVDARWRAPDTLTLTMRNDRGQIREWPLEVGAEIALAADMRRCVGARLPGRSKLAPCPSGQSLRRGSQCPACFARSALLPCLRCTGERCGNHLRRSRCIQPANHYLYLAIVAPGLTKVGVARVERIRERLGEQGVRNALGLARLDGREVRLWEHRISQLGIRDRLPLPEKLHSWCDDAPHVQLAEELANTAATIARRLPGPFLETPLQLPQPPLPALERLPRLLRADDLSLRGTILALYGKTLIVQHEHGETVALDADALIGLELRTLDAEETAVGQMALQL